MTMQCICKPMYVCMTYPLVNVLLALFKFLIEGIALIRIFRLLGRQAYQNRVPFLEFLHPANLPCIDLGQCVPYVWEMVWKGDGTFIANIRQHAPPVIT